MKNKALNIYSEYITEAKKLYSIAASELKEATKLNIERIDNAKCKVQNEK